MPQRTTEYTITTGNTVELFTFKVDSQTLEALNITLIDDPETANAAYAQIGLLAGGQTKAHKLITFDQGYLDDTNDISWTGSIHLPDDCWLFARVISDTTRALRLTALLWDFIPPPLREKTPNALR